MPETSTAGPDRRPGSVGKPSYTPSIRALRHAPSGSSAVLVRVAATARSDRSGGPNRKGQQARKKCGGAQGNLTAPRRFPHPIVQGGATGFRPHPRLTPANQSAATETRGLGLRATVSVGTTSIFIEHGPLMTVPETPDQSDSSGGCAPRWGVSSLSHRSFFGPSRSQARSRRGQGPAFVRCPTLLDWPRPQWFSHSLWNGRCSGNPPHLDGCPAQQKKLGVIARDSHAAKKAPRQPGPTPPSMPWFPSPPPDTFYRYILLEQTQDSFRAQAVGIEGMMGDIWEIDPRGRTEVVRDLVSVVTANPKAHRVLKSIPRPQHARRLGPVQFADVASTFSLIWTRLPRPASLVSRDHIAQGFQ